MIVIDEPVIYFYNQDNATITILGMPIFFPLFNLPSGGSILPPKTPLTQFPMSDLQKRPEKS
jgi:hypothetical protein